MGELLATKKREHIQVSAQLKTFTEQANNQRDEMHRLLKKRNENEVKLQQDILVRNTTI